MAFFVFLGYGEPQCTGRRQQALMKLPLCHGASPLPQRRRTNGQKPYPQLIPPLPARNAHSFALHVRWRSDKIIVPLVLALI